MLDINDTTTLRRGLQISENVTLDLLTKGVVNTTTADHNISQTHFLYEDDIFGPNPYLPQKWKIARNLQNLSQNILETLMDEFQEELMIHSAYVNPNIAQRNTYSENSRHFTGEAIDISTKSFESNMLYMIPEMQKMFKGKLAEIGLIYNQRSWVHIGIKGEHSVLGGDTENPRVFTRDMTNNNSWSGIYPARGLYVQKPSGYLPLRLNSPYNDNRAVFD